MIILTAVGGEYEQDRVVEVGHDLATAYDDDLVVLHVMEENQFEDLRGRTGITGSVPVVGADEEASLLYPTSERSSEQSEYNIEDAVADAESVAQECISRTLSGDQGTRVTAKGQVGDPADKIIAEAEQIDPRYIVVGGRKQSPTKKAIFGSVSQSIILNSGRPVVTITRTGEEL